MSITRVLAREKLIRRGFKGEGVGIGETNRSPIVPWSTIAVSQKLQQIIPNDRCVTAFSLLNRAMSRAVRCQSRGHQSVGEGATE